MFFLGTSQSISDKLLHDSYIINLTRPYVIVKNTTLWSNIRGTVAPSFRHLTLNLELQSENKNQYNMKCLSWWKIVKYKNLKIGNREVRNICTFFQTDNLKPETIDKIYLFHYR